MGFLALPDDFMRTVFTTSSHADSTFFFSQGTRKLQFFLMIVRKTLRAPVPVFNHCLRSVPYVALTALEPDPCRRSVSKSFQKRTALRFYNLFDISFRDFPVLTAIETPSPPRNSVPCCGELMSFIAFHNDTGCHRRYGNGDKFALLLSNKAQHCFLYGIED